MHVDLDRAGQGCRRRVVEVGAAPATVPEGVLVGSLLGKEFGRGEDQKFEGEYLLATRRMARVESEVEGKMEWVELG